MSAKGENGWKRSSDEIHRDPEFRARVFNSSNEVISLDYRERFGDGAELGSLADGCLNGIEETWLFAKSADRGRHDLGRE